MFRFLSNIPISVHIFLLILIPILRLPSFGNTFFLAEESYLLLVAQKLAEGADLYKDAWLAGPPIMAWFYGIFSYLFGDSALTAIRVFTCIYIYISAVYFNGVLATYKPFRSYIGLTSILFVLLTSVPWYTQQMSASLFVLLPVIIAFHSVIRLSENRPANYRLMFQAGLWMMVSILASFKIVFLLLGIILAYLVLHSPRLDEFFSLLGGLFTVLMFLFVGLLLTDSMMEAWDQGLLYYLDRLGLAGQAVYVFEPLTTLKLWILSWGIFLLLAIIGFFHFRLRFYSYVTQIRSVELTMAVWLVGVLLVLIFKYKRLELSDFVLIVPPLVFYASKALDLKWVYKLRMLVLLLGVAMPIFTYMGYWINAFPDTFSAFSSMSELEFLHGGSHNFHKENPELFSLEAAEDTKKQMWVMDAQPQWYHLLGGKCANKYTDFRMAYFKFPSLPGSQTDLFSRPESERDIFLQFSENPPDLILDPHNYFQLMKTRYPNIFRDFYPRRMGDYLIYMRQ